MDIKRWIGAMAFTPMAAIASVQYDHAAVIGVRPIVETVRYAAPREECSQREIPYRQQASGSTNATPTILGAILGGALGNALGHDTSNEKVGAAVGAVLGGAVGYDWSRRRTAAATPAVVYYRTEQVCNVVQDVREEERIAAYDVTYTYLGQTYTTRMNRDPGRTVRVRVQVTLAP